MPLNTPPFKNIKTLVRDISISAHSLRASTENVSWLWSCWSVPFLSSSLSLLPVRSGMSPSHYCPLLQLTSSSSPLLTSSTSLPSVKLATSLSHLRHLKILVENIPCFQYTEKGMYCELHNILPELALVSQLKKSSLLQSRVATPGGNMTWYWAEAQIFELLPYVQVILIFEAILFTWVLNSSFSAPCRVRPHSLSNPQGVHSQTSAGHCRSHKCCTMHMHCTCFFPLSCSAGRILKMTLTEEAAFNLSPSILNDLSSAMHCNGWQWNAWSRSLQVASPVTIFLPTYIVHISDNLQFEGAF